MYNLFSYSIVQVEEQKNIGREISKTRKNTRKHAKYDLKNAKEALKRAERERDKENLERYCMDSLQKSVDSVEKNGKVLAEMKGIEKTKVGNREIRCSHSNVEINNELKKVGVDFIGSEDAEFLDSFASHENGCGSTHSELGYGGVTPSYSEAERAYQIAVKANEVVNSKEEKEESMKNLLQQNDLVTMGR